MLLLLVSVIRLPKITPDLTSSAIFASHSEPRCCTSAEEYKRLCALLSLHAGSSSQTWLPGIPGLLEGSEAETKPLAPVLLSPGAFCLSALNGGSLLPAVAGVPRPPFTALTSDTERPFAAHWEKTHNTPLTQCTRLHHRWALQLCHVNPAPEPSRSSAGWEEQKTPFTSG